MPSSLSGAVPPTANKTHTTAEMAAALNDMRRRKASCAPSVSPARMGRSDYGSTTTSRTTKNFTSSSSMASSRVSRLELRVAQVYKQGQDTKRKDASRTRR
jgi:hypothetical protein